MRHRVTLFLGLLLLLPFAGGIAGVGASFPPFSFTPPEQIARAYLLANASVYGVTPADLGDLHLDLYREDPVTRAHYVVFLQTLDGIPVHNAVLNVTLSPDGEVVHVGNRAEPDIAARAAGNADSVIDQHSAVEHAARVLGLSYTPASVRPVQTASTFAQEVRFAGGDLSLEEIPVRLTYLPVPDGSLRLAWDLHIYQRNAQHWWNVRLDAATGDLLDQQDWVIHEEVQKEEFSAKSEEFFTLPSSLFTPSFTQYLTGTYRAYPIPVESPSHSTPPSPADGRVLVVDPALPSASPFGWHDTDGVPGAEFTTTQGNNSHAYLDLDANGIPDPGSSPDGGTGLIFDFPIDLTQPPSAYRPAVVADYFYWTNVLHDVSYLYGFTEAARNFQENNYGNGGLGSDYLYAEAQDGSGTNGGTFSVGPDGTNPRMQMYIWTIANPDRDGALDRGVVSHEYGHGIANRMTGNGSSCLGNPEAMLEGWADWQSVLLTMRPGDTATTNRPVGTYILGQPPTGPGIRPAPYTTDFAVNAYTYAHVPTAAIPHGIGFIWNTMLWEMNWELIAAHGFNPDIYGAPASGGNNLAYKLVMDGLAIQPCSPGFVDGRDAILAADVINTGGENQCRIWAAFARRGLGNSASQGSSNSTTDGTAAFDLPPQCSGATPTPTSTATSVPPSLTPTPTSVATLTATPTALPPTETPTATAVPGTLTPTVTPEAPTATATPSHVPPTVSATSTSAPPSSTPTATVSPPTVTPTSTDVPLPNTPTSTATPPLLRLYLPSIRNK